jgi:hypothetical protein
VLVIPVRSVTIVLALLPEKTGPARSRLKAIDHHLEGIGLLELA